MDVPNAFIGKADPPTEAEVATVLGPVAPLWNELIREVTADAGKVTEEWKGIYVNKYGWSFRLKKKGRNIIFMAPCNGCFQVVSIFNDRAIQAAKGAHWPRKVADALTAAPHYPEGWGLRLMVYKASDVAPIRKLAQIKLAN